MQRADEIFAFLQLRARLFQLLHGGGGVRRFPERGVFLLQTAQLFLLLAETLFIAVFQLAEATVFLFDKAVDILPAVSVERCAEAGALFVFSFHVQL